MVFTPLAVYSDVTIPTGTNLGLNPVGLNVSGVNYPGLIFNFVLESEGLSPGPNPVINFRYCFSVNSYSGSAIPATLGRSAVVVPLRVPTAINTSFDITYNKVVPVLGPNLYCWFDALNFVNTAIINLDISGMSSTGSNSMDFSEASNSGYIALISFL